MTQPEQEQWHVRQEVSPGNFRTLHSGSERSARQFVTDNFPRPHAVQGQDTVRSDVQLHGPNGEKHEYHGVDAVGADESGWVNLDASEADDDDNGEVTL